MMAITAPQFGLRMFETCHHVRNEPPCTKTSTAMTLSADDEDYRIGKVTGSLVNILMNAKSEAELNKAFLVKTGQEPPPPTTWAMKAGSHMESLILDELELRIGHAITRRGEIADHPTEKDACV